MLTDIMLAINLASRVHTGQVRFYTQEPYVNHVIRVASHPIEPEVTEDVVTEDTAKDTAEETVPENPIIKVDTVEVTAKQLGRDYEIDGYRSDKLYEDKALTVTGEVDNIFISASSDKAIVFLKTENEQIPVMASGEAAFATKVKDLKNKDTVELLCQGTKAVSKAPQVNECTVL